MRTVNLSNDYELYRSGLLAASEQSIMVYDYQNAGLYQFDYDLNKIGRFGREGRGPGEFQNPTDLVSDKSGNFWIVDGRTSRITQWSGKGELVYEKPVPFGIIPHRYASINDSEFVLFSLMGQSCMHVVNRDGKVSHSFLSVSGFDFNRRGFLLEGQITADDEIIYYAGRRNDLIKAYSKDGALIYSRTVIHPVNTELLNLDAGELRSSPLSALDIEVYGDHLFILSGGARNDPNRWRYLDVYDKNSGNYKYTFLLESFARKFTINKREDGETYLIVLGNFQNTEDRGLSLYKLPDLP